MVPLLAALCLSAPAPRPSPAEIAAQPRIYTAVRTSEEMTIDGSANEAVWHRTPSDDRFVMRDPELGGRPEARTTVRVAYDNLALYILVDAEMDPGDIVLRTLRRDTFALFSDDNVSVKIDARHDRRTSLIFSTNTAGAQIDIMSLEDGKVGLRQWDAVWQVEARRHAGGWTAEFRLPFAVLGVESGADLTMGLNITRDHQVANATYDWRLMLPPRRPTSASAFGELHGLKDIESKRAIEITPYLSGRTDFHRGFAIDPRDSPNLSAGGDMRVQVGARSYVEASVFTDFAQVEADEIQVAQDRFPLFFPERRPFFINGLDVFNFGREGEAQLFFSRQIGLSEGRPVPIAAGVKAYGRGRKFSYGVLNVQTMSARAPDDDETDNADNADNADRPPENFSMARLRYRPHPRLSVGIIALGRHRWGASGHEAFSSGIDADVRALGAKLRWYSFVARTWEQRPATSETLPTRLTLAKRQRTAAGRSLYSAVEYDGLYLRPAAMLLWSDARFTAPLGFYRRPGTAQHRARFMFAPRPRALALRELEVGPFAGITTTPSYDRVLTADTGAQLEAKWRSSWEAEYNLRYRDDRVEDAFELYQHNVDAGRYRGLTHEVRAESPRRFAVSGALSYEHGSLFDGVAHRLRGRLRTKLSKHAAIEASYTHLAGHLRDPDASFNFGYANGAVNLALNRDISWDTSVRLNLEPGGETYGIQSRIRWRYLPGSDFFLVYNTAQPWATDPTDDTQAERFHAVTLKATYYFQALLGT